MSRLGGIEKVSTSPSPMEGGTAPQSCLYSLATKTSFVNIEISISKLRIAGDHRRRVGLEDILGTGC